jgi:hypothetical protein
MVDKNQSSEQITLVIRPKVERKNLVEMIDILDKR